MHSFHFIQMILCGVQYATSLRLSSLPEPPIQNPDEKMKMQKMEMDETTAIQAAIDLWDGLEFPGQTDYDPAMNKRWPEKISIFGLMNSGTNLAQTMIYNANPNLSVCPDSSQSHFRQEYGCHHRQIHKHSHPAHVKEWIENKGVQAGHEGLKDGQDGQIFVFIVRNPFSNMDALHRHPYDLKKCLKGETWLQNACPCQDIHGPNENVFCQNKSDTFQSTVQIWNSFVAGYQALVKSLGPTRAVLVRYEDLVEAPHNFFTELQGTLKQELSEDLALGRTSQSAKQNGIGRAQAIRKKSERTYLQKYTPDMVKFLCENVDQSLMQSYGYIDDCS